MHKATPIKQMKSALKQAAIECIEFNSGTLELSELTELSIARVHSSAPQTGLPAGTGQCSGEDPAILCLRPGEWLSVSETLELQALQEALTQMTGAGLSSVDDHSHGLAVFRLQGEGSPWLLSKLSGLDYLAGRSAGTHCAETRMGQISVLVHYHGFNNEADVYDLIIDRSYARYFWELLTESSAHADDLALAYPTSRI
jgi:heterotetrameric sarcosine oxidase gamma subunit